MRTSLLFIPEMRGAVSCTIMIYYGSNYVSYLQAVFCSVLSIHIAWAEKREERDFHVHKSFKAAHLDGSGENYKIKVDFSRCDEDPNTGFCCVDKVMEMMGMTTKKPSLTCTYKNVMQCHFTYITQFSPQQEEVCQEIYEKRCSITFKQQAYNETVKKCYRPVEKVCDGVGVEDCETVYQTSCTTRYVENKENKYVGDTACQRIPLKLCGAGCVFKEGLEECHDDIVTTVVEVPEELCELQPHKTCRHVTKLVPRLKPVP